MTVIFKELTIQKNRNSRIAPKFSRTQKLMTFDQWIAFGTFLVTAIPLAIVGCLFLYKRFRSIRVRVGFDCQNGAYISALNLRANQPPVASSLAAWTQLHIYNGSSEKIAIVSIHAGYADGAASSAITPLFQRVDFEFESEKPFSPIELPISIDVRDPKILWCLLKIPVSASVGTLVFSKYGTAIDQLPSVSRVATLLSAFPKNDLAADLRKKIPYVELEDIKVAEISADDPFITRSGDDVKFNPRFGRVRKYAIGELLPEISEHFGQPPQTIGDKQVPYVITIQLGDGRKLVSQINSTRSPLWFLKSRRPDSV